MDTAKPRSLSILPPQVHQYFPPQVPFLRYGTHGDGTCFFHSVCAARNEQGYLQTTPGEQKRIGRQYRRDFTKHITDSKWNEFAKGQSVEISPEEARRNFRDSKHWANQSMIQFVADILKLNLLFIDTEKSTLYCGVHGEKSEPLIVILWVQHAHFEPVGACRALEGDRTGVQFVFDPVKDAAIVDHIMNKYRGQCSA
jgi:hypothetical protein